MPYFYVGDTWSNGGVYQNYWYAGNQVGLTGMRTSGAVSGDHQHLTGTVISMNNSVNNSAGVGWVDGLALGFCSVVGGDSGGPVFNVVEGGKNAMMGIVQGTPDPPFDFLCYYTPTNIIAANHGGAPAGY